MTSEQEVTTCGTLKSDSSSLNDSRHKDFATTRGNGPAGVTSMSVTFARAGEGSDKGVAVAALRGGDPEDWILREDGQKATVSMRRKDDPAFRSRRGRGEVRLSPEQGLGGCKAEGWRAR